jgi:hypothetical protein
MKNKKLSSDLRAFGCFFVGLKQDGATLGVGGSEEHALAFGTSEFGWFEIVDHYYLSAD